MNEMTRLVKYMDAVYGTDDLQRSKLVKIAQYYDQSANTHVVRLEYRYKRNDGSIVAKQVKENSFLQRLLLK